MSPLVVTCPDGDQSWEMRAQVPESGGPPQPPGSTMTIDHEYPDGGTFDSVLFVLPMLKFTRLDATGPVIGPFPSPIVLQLEPQDEPTPWCHTFNPLHDPPNQYLIELAGVTTNFAPGVTCPDSPHMPGYGLNGERTKRSIKDIDIAEQKYGHEVRAGEKSSIGGVTELFIDGSTTPAEGSGSASDYTVPIAAAIAAGALALVASGWYARRRWLG